MKYIFLAYLSEHWHKHLVPFFLAALMMGHLKFFHHMLPESAFNCTIRTFDFTEKPCAVLFDAGVIIRESG